VKNTWTPEQDELLKKLWPTGESLKPYLELFGNRSYTTIITHAHRNLQLGSRPKSARGVPGYAWDMIKEGLKKAPGTAPELIKRTGLTMAPVCKRLSDAPKGKHGEIHILMWRKRSTGGDPVAVYAYGPGPNAKKPEPFTAHEKWLLKVARREAKSNPFSTAAGLSVLPVGGGGRVYQHSMDVADEPMEAEAA
jgi:hypothetical protein